MVTGLETRGYRPMRHERDLIAAYIFRKMDHEYRLARPTFIHSFLWGTPCGPTLSMANPPHLIGLQWLMEERVAMQPRKPFGFVDIQLS